jgi:hypothetical protein
VGDRYGCEEAQIPFRNSTGSDARPSPTPTPTATPVTGWDYAYYSYEFSHPHAVATIVRDATPDSFTYDASGNMTDRDEGEDA